MESERKYKNLAYADRSRLAQFLAITLLKNGHQVGFRDENSDCPVLAIRLTQDRSMIHAYPGGTGRTFARDEIAFHIARGDLLFTKDEIKTYLCAYPHSWEFEGLLEGKSDEEKDVIYERDSVQRAESMRKALNEALSSISSQ